MDAQKLNRPNTFCALVLSKAKINQQSNQGACSKSRVCITNIRTVQTVSVQNESPKYLTYSFQLFRLTLAVL